MIDFFKKKNFSNQDKTDRIKENVSCSDGCQTHLGFILLLILERHEHSVRIQGEGGGTRMREEGRG